MCAISGFSCRKVLSCRMQKLPVCERVSLYFFFLLILGHFAPDMFNRLAPLLPGLGPRKRLLPVLYTALPFSNFIEDKKNQAPGLTRFLPSSTPASGVPHALQAGEPQNGEGYAHRSAGIHCRGGHALCPILGETQKCTFAGTHSKMYAVLSRS